MLCRTFKYYGQRLPAHALLITHAYLCAHALLIIHAYLYARALLSTSRIFACVGFYVLPHS